MGALLYNGVLLNFIFCEKMADNLMLNDNETLLLAGYAERAYLEYAMSVVKGRALPAVEDGQKPVQRRILYAMYDMNLIHGAKPVKSARVVGEILGKYHPHGDTSAYHAMVRMAQEFTLRYPLIDGIGNFGSRDGDGAAAMRYTEARLMPIAELLLSEINMGTVDFTPNYDGAFNEPVLLPARLPMALLNGASGIAVGMATEIPSHNLHEVANATLALLKNRHLSVQDLLAYMPGPDFAGGGHIISTTKDIQNIYETGKGSVRVRARYTIEKLARGQWRVLVHELPPGTSAQKILAQIEDLSNPKPRGGKKNLTQDQQNNKNLMLSLLDRVRDESDNQEPVRLVFEPKSSRQNPEEMMQILMAQTDLETNVSINLVMIGQNGRPAQKNLHDILNEWLDFRISTVTRRLQYRLTQVQKRIHILEGRMIVFLHIDEVIRVIRESDSPKPELMSAFALSEMQAEDILEIRLRQLARLEWIKLEKELATLREEEGSLKHLLDNESAKKKLISQEIKADAKKYGDERRTLMEAAERSVLVQSTADDPITLILSQKGWLRARVGHHLDLQQTSFKEGDALQQVIETRTIWPVVILDSQGRSYTIDAADIPGGRGDGVPVTSLIELQAGAKIVGMMSAKEQTHYLLYGTGGYGFIAKLEDMSSRVKAGKVLMNIDEGEHCLMPVMLPETVMDAKDEYRIILATDEPRLLAFSLSEMRIMSKGRGLQMVSLPEGGHLCELIVSNQAEYLVESEGRRGGQYQDKLHTADILNKRGRKGKPLNLSGSLKKLSTLLDKES